MPTISPPGPLCPQVDPPDQLAQILSQTVAASTVEELSLVKDTLNRQPLNKTAGKTIGEALGYQA